MSKPIPNILKRLFFDIETSPNIVLSWRTGYKLNIGHDSILQERGIICICYKWEDDEKVDYLTWDSKQNDRKMLEKFIKIAKEADQLIAHNGDRFDIKWVQTRCLYHRIPSFPKYQTLDTLKIAKSNFYFNSNRLDYIARFLGFDGKSEMSYQDWKDILLNKSKDAMNKMVSYCKKDVVLLEQVYKELSKYSEHKMHVGVLHGDEKWSCGHCGSQDVYCNKTRVTKMGTIRRQMYCRSCDGHTTISNKSYMNYLQEKMK